MGRRKWWRYSGSSRPCPAAKVAARRFCSIAGATARIRRRSRADPDAERRAAFFHAAPAVRAAGSVGARQMQHGQTLI